MTSAKQAEINEARARLREWLKPGDTVFTILRHTSQSGMFRVVSLITLHDNEPLWLSSNVAKALDRRYDERREGVKISGCGMDMGFALVYDLGSVLYPETAYPFTHRWL